MVISRNFVTLVNDKLMLFIIRTCDGSIHLLIDDVKLDFSTIRHELFANTQLEMFG